MRETESLLLKGLGQYREVNDLFNLILCFIHGLSPGKMRTLCYGPMQSDQFQMYEI